MPDLVSINPYNLEKIAFHPEDTNEQLEQKISKSRRAYLSLKKSSLQLRRDGVYAIAQSLRQNREIFAEHISIEMGKPISESRAEIEKCAWLCNYYVDNAPVFLKDRKIETDANSSYVAYRPLGTVLGIMPWNFPFWQVFRFAIPAFLAGNSLLLKHASNVQLCAKSIELLFTHHIEIENSLINLCVGSDKIAHVIKNDAVAAVSLTGSEKAGSAVASLAGKHIKKTVLELGGSDAYLILEDADLELAAEQTVLSRMLNCGQSCIGAKRILIHQNVYQQFRDILLGKLSAYKPSNPLEEDCVLGPMARMDLKHELHQQVLSGINSGAAISSGELKISEDNAFYAPCVLENVDSDMSVMKEELFGPVLPLVKCASEDQMISIANSSNFGLGAAVFSNDVERAEKIARDKLDAGSCFVNAFVRSDPRLPFGGIKKSGFGRELADVGIREFCNVKTVYRV